MLGEEKIMASEMSTPRSSVYEFVTLYGQRNFADAIKL
jgi:hypothetical protein